MISQDHGNRAQYNWLAYKSSDRILEGHAALYKGVLYDLGAGESPYRNFFLRHADQYVAVDWSDSHHATMPDIVADLNEILPLASDVADTVVSLSVLEHLSDPQTMLNEAFRILKSGGGIVLQVPWQWRIHEAPHDYFRYTPHGLEYLMRKAGFVDIRVEPQAGFFSMMTLKMNYFSLRLILGPWLLRKAIGAVFSVCWYIGQKVAPLLDRLDRDWALETSGYFVTARKP